jgi:Zn-dependent M16 (insulinase) family peptidase
VSKEPINYPTTIEMISLDNCVLETHWRTSITNQISYVYLKFDITWLDEELRPYIPLFCRSLTSLGTKSKTLSELDELIRASTGGISASCFTRPIKDDLMRNESFIEISGNAIDSNLENLYSLLRQVLFETNWNAKDELFTCLQTQLSDYSSAVVGSGHVYAMRLAASDLTPSAKQSEEWKGISQIKFLEGLSSKNDMDDVMRKLKVIAF